MGNGSWGGARTGAGRKKTSPFVPHSKRPRLEGLRKPTKVTFRLRSQYPSLQDPALYSVFHRASLRARGFGLRILHFALHARTLHLICEFDNQKSLESSLKSLSTALAIALKKSAAANLPPESNQLRGPVFLGRFMMEILETPEHLRIATRDMFCNVFESAENFKFSSACIFGRWKYLFSDESTENKAKIPGLVVAQDQLPELPYKRMATEITARPLFSLSKSLEKSKANEAYEPRALGDQPDSSLVVIPELAAEL